VQNSRFEFRFFFTPAFVFCVFAFPGQGSRSTLAESAIVPQPASYSPMDAVALPSEWLVILQAANARRIPTAALDSVGQAEWLPTATIHEIDPEEQTSTQCSASSRGERSHAPNGSLPLCRERGTAMRSRSTAIAISNAWDAFLQNGTER
jgi:hypothetical protein